MSSPFVGIPLELMWGDNGMGHLGLAKTWGKTRFSKQLEALQSPTMSSFLVDVNYGPRIGPPPDLFGVPGYLLLPWARLKGSPLARYPLVGCLLSTYDLSAFGSKLSKHPSKNCIAGFFRAYLSGCIINDPGLISWNPTPAINRNNFRRPE